MIKWFLFVVLSLCVILYIYKKSWFLKLHVHNILGYIYELRKNSSEEFVVPEKIKGRNAKKPIGFKSYINDTQNVHPKVLYFENEFANHRFWMSYSPYPWYIDRYENPCIAFSDNGYDWTNIINNPIDDAHGNGYNSDPHLVFREDTNTIECWYRHVGKYSKPPVEEVIHRRTSTDGINWSEDQILIKNYSGKYASILSPAILWDKNVYHIWSVNKEKDFLIEYHCLNSNGEFVKIRDFNFKYTFGESKTCYVPWHLDVIKDEDKYVMLIMCKERKGTGPRRWDLFMAMSDDNINYSAPELVLHGTKNGWDNNIYRSSIVRVNGKYRIYYSALNNIGKHGIGIINI